MTNCLQPLILQCGIAFLGYKMLYVLAFWRSNSFQDFLWETELYSSHLWSYMSKKIKWNNDKQENIYNFVVTYSLQINILINKYKIEWANQMKSFCFLNSSQTLCNRGLFLLRHALEGQILQRRNHFYYYKYISAYDIIYF